MTIFSSVSKANEAAIGADFAQGSGYFVNLTELKIHSHFETLEEVLEHVSWYKYVLEAKIPESVLYLIGSCLRDSKREFTLKNGT